MAEESTARDYRLTDLIHELHKRLGRMPEEEEVFTFIMGSDEDREQIWNTNKPKE
jgi:hypothetical protein